MSNTSHIRRNRHAVMAATIAAASASWAVATQVAGVHLGVRFPHAGPSVVGLGSTIGAAATTTVLGWGVLVLLETRVSRPGRTWTALAVAVALVSLGLPAAFATTVSAAIALVSIHVAVAFVAITGLSRTATERRSPTGLPYRSTAAPHPVP